MTGGELERLASDGVDAILGYYRERTEAGNLGIMGKVLEDRPGVQVQSLAVYARDLAVIFRAAMANPVFAQITAEPSAMFPGDNGDHPIANHDELLTRYPGAIGGKTGFTDAARKTFVGAAARGGRRLVVAMMYGLVHEGGPTYWDQAGGLLDWGFALNPQSSIGTL